ncbi:MAG: SH3 domain-containing protein [Devosia nanyangense]|uniref:SH3 domain-containing protein n=1 Tax=Devosia nanyangense TaxID=1228055 RepID=A0A933NXY3_9HYPH|nr:SH3 domain-containing protein [Devosia nanyangense]
MTSLPRLIAPVLVAAGLIFSATAANAAAGVALVNANVRSGPGIGYGVVDTLDIGEYVIVVSCAGAWCNVHHIGPDGFVARSLLINPYYPVRPYNFAPKHGLGPGRGDQPGR